MNFNSHTGFSKFSQLGDIDFEIEWCKNCEPINFVHPNQRNWLKKLKFLFFTEFKE